MKFKYVGEDNCFCIELVAYKLVPRGSYLKNGQVITVPDNEKIVINALRTNGVFEEIQDNKKITKKVNNKEDKE